MRRLRGSSPAIAGMPSAGGAGMLSADFISVSQLQSDQQLLEQSVRFARRLGFDTISVMAVLENASDTPIFCSIENVPSAAREQYGDLERGRRDPVMQHCKKSSLPILWGRETYEGVGKASMWEEQAPFGLCAGIAVAAHLPNGQHLMIGMDRDQPLPRNVDYMTAVAAELQLFLACAVDAALSVLLREARSDQHTVLTPRELEVLRWTMEGKTAWELGFILGISEQTAARHINNATQKLGCVNKMQAVIKALRLGLFQ